MLVGSLDTPHNIKNVMAVVRNLPGMVVGSALWWKASSLLTKQSMREMFLAQEDPELQLQCSSNNNDNVDDKVLTSEDDDIFDLAVCATGIAVEYYLKYFLKTPCRTSSHTELYKSNLVWNQLEACLKLAMTIIKPKDPSFSNVHPKLRNDDRYWPYFKDCIGAIDYTHVPCIVPSQEQIKYIGRKGVTFQNIMAVCDWDMCFTFVWPRWEGTAHDYRIFDQAIRRQDLNFPHPPPLDKYYLVDSGYPTTTEFLGPYKGDRYHLPDFRRATDFRNPNEVFNYYHSSLRCTIEKFRVWKNKFQILRSMPPFKFDTQVHLVTATMAIHNLIRQHSSIDVDFIHYANNDEIVLEMEKGDGSYNTPLYMQSRSSTFMESTRNRIRDEIVENSPYV
ncbi:putative nuclease HARBI1 [Senna tora]|uniref:Putative nuclease HARBI1 n=1 Tax=Senna tora TaxID=362788 RepID=A0A834X802_9FABA|nr:putative nuclease HARBI1 [Senna tora]